jgi:hypothetical protein
VVRQFDNSYVISVLEGHECDWCGKTFQGDPAPHCPACTKVLQTCKRCGREYDTGEPFCSRCIGKPGRWLFDRIPLTMQVRFVRWQWRFARAFPRLAAWGYVELGMTGQGTGPPRETSQETVREYREELLAYRRSRLITPVYTPADPAP